MKKAQKKEADNLIKLLGQAHDQIKKDLEKQDIQEAMTLLQDCQDGAVALGTLIEKVEGEGIRTVSLLEEYCELVFQMHESLAQKDNTRANKIYKVVRQQLVKISNSAAKDIPIRKEVVFIPYKASMWDSLESVWRAAEADPDCDAYVVPIPYYDKNPDGSFREMHYEGNLYPKDVPVTYYKDYDFESRQPDVIFYHNPYDENNYVTSVEPYFYSTNLKKFTDMLVYIPYFILGEIDPADRAAVEGMEHFVMHQGVMNADRVIVQSDSMRQIYIDVLTRHLGANTRKVLEKKILGLGSPKIDKVLNTRKEDLEIPVEWLRIIRKPDGSWKKIILYNTSVTALLNNNDKMLEKMQDVFRVFKENQDEVALLWRPHPLIQATIESMRPQLWTEYKKLREQYRTEGWGIYDDSADMNRAIAVSDAYYGDSSSLVQLYQKTGKPTLLQNVSSLPENNYSLAMDNVVEYQGEWWFLALKDNGIYRMNKETFEATLVVRIPWDGYGGMPQYGKIYIYQNKIFAVPWAPINITVYDIQTQSLHYLDYEKETINRGMVFCEGVVDRNKLYLIPCAYENILCIDMDTEDITYIRLDEALHEKGKKHQFAWGNVFFDEKTIYMTMLDSDRILSYGVRSGKIGIYQSELLSGGCAGICGDEDSVWVVPKATNRIIHWDRKQQTADIIKDFPQGYQSGDFSFHKLQICGRYLYLLPRSANMGIVIDKKRGEISGIEFGGVPADMENFYNKYLRYANIWEKQKDIYIVQARKGDIYCINGEDRKIIQVEKQIRLIEECREIMQLHDVVEHENRFESINNFCKNIKLSVKKTMDSEMHMAGNNIWQSMK